MNRLSLYVCVGFCPALFSCGDAADGERVGEKVGTSEAALNYLGDCPPFTDDQVCACSNGPFKAPCAVLDSQRRFYPTPEAMGLDNDSISSIATGANVKLRYCADAGMEGACANLASGQRVAALSGNPGNDSISSLRIDPKTQNCQTVGARQVALFKDANFTGDCVVLNLPPGATEAYFPNTTATSDAAGLNGSFGLPNDSMSSIRVGSGVRAIVYADANYFEGLKGSFIGSQQALYEPGSYATGSNVTLGANVDDTATGLVIIQNNGTKVAFNYKDTVPNNPSPPWGESPNGLAHDNANWYITNLWNVYQYLLTDDISGPERKKFNMNDFTDYPGPLDGIPITWMSPDCHHFGDPDAVTVDGHPWLFVPIEGCHDPYTGSPQTFLAVFDGAPSDHPGTMKLQCVDELYFQPTNAALVSINPANPGVLFSPGGNLTGSGEDQMFTYQIHYENLPTCNLRACLAGLAAGGLPDSCLLSNGPGDSTQPMQIKPGTVASVDELLEVGYYSGVDCWGDLIGRGPGVNIGEPQGGVFSTDGKLYYLANGGSYQGCHRDTNALRVFDTTTPVWTEIARAWDDYYGYFSYACKDGCTAPLDDEPEGIDYLDLTQVNAGPLTGHGQLHAMLYNNPVYGAGDTYLKHYYTTVP